MKRTWLTFLVAIQAASQMMAQNGSGDLSGSLSLSPGYPTAKWPESGESNLLSPNCTANIQVTVSHNGTVNGVEYEIATGPNVTTASSDPNVIWSPSGGSSGTFSVTNTAADQANASVAVTCSWKPAGSGGSGGTAPPNIHGKGTGTVALLDSKVVWSTSSAVDVNGVKYMAQPVAGPSVLLEGRFFDNAGFAIQCTLVSGQNVDPLSSGVNVTMHPDPGATTGTAYLDCSADEPKLARVKLNYNDGSAETSIPPVSVAFLQIDVTPVSTPFVLWYVEGLEPSGYPVKQDVQAKLSFGLDNEFDWYISSGTEYVGLTDSENTTDTATAKSIGKSLASDDCEVAATSKKFPNVQGGFNFNTEYFIEAEPMGSETAAPAQAMYANYAWITEIKYKMRTQFGTTPKKSIPFNEKFTNHRNSSTWDPNNWDQPPNRIGDWTVYITDLISPVTGSSYAPQPARPGDTTNPVDDYDGEWRVGSQQYGSGTTILKKKWVRYIAKGEHQ